MSNSGLMPAYGSDKRCVTIRLAMFQHLKWHSMPGGRILSLVKNL